MRTRRNAPEAFDEIHIEISEIRDLEDRFVAIGRTRARGEGSGADVESRIGFVTGFKNGKAISIRGYLDPKEALEAAGAREGPWRASLDPAPFSLLSGRTRGIAAG